MGQIIKSLAFCLSVSTSTATFLFDFNEILHSGSSLLGPDSF